jgi:hypothetical protein
MDVAIGDTFPANLSILPEYQRRDFVLRMSQDLDMALSESELVTGAYAHQAANLRHVIQALRELLQRNENVLKELAIANNEALAFLKRLLRERSGRY